jgi:hypothetical protein
VKLIKANSTGLPEFQLVVRPRKRFKHMKRLTRLALLAGVSFAAPAHAADITWGWYRSGNAIHIDITGEIVAGDMQKFRAVSGEVIDALLRARKLDVDVWLESPGGLINEGLAIGDHIRLAGYGTVVGSNEECASVCGLIWLASKDRAAFPTSQIGFHAAFVEKPHRCWLLFTCATVEVSSAANAAVGAYLQRLNFGQAAIRFLTSAAPESMKWLDFESAKKAGIAITMIKPKKGN